MLGDEQPGQNCTNLCAFVKTCRCLGINPEEYLTDVLTRFPGMLAKDPNTLTPATRLEAGNGKAI